MNLAVAADRDRAKQIMQWQDLQTDRGQALAVAHLPRQLGAEARLDLEAPEGQLPALSSPIVRGNQIAHPARLGVDRQPGRSTSQASLRSD